MGVWLGRWFNFDWRAIGVELREHRLYRARHDLPDAVARFRFGPHADGRAKAVAANGYRGRSDL